MDDLTRLKHRIRWRKGNALSASVSSSLFASLNATGISNAKINFGANQLSGSVPTFFDHLPLQLNYATFNLSKNKLSGSLPAYLTPNSSFSEMEEVYWYLDSNAISGAIPDTIASRPSGLAYFWVYLSNNSLTGTVPSTLFDNIRGAAGQSAGLVLDLSRNRLSGSLSSINFTAMTNVFGLNLDLSFNSLGGSLPEGFPGSNYPSINTLELNFTNCGLTGTIPTMILPNWNTFSLSLDYNQLTGSYPW